ncbi:MAG: hypothetical protein P8020_09015 [Acidobacteriota bacterium]|jgi:hypothetical protein
MRILIFKGRIGLSVSLTGLFLFAAVFSAFVLTDGLGSEITPAQAERRILLYYRTQISHRHQAELQARGLRIPGPDLARRWGAELRQVRSFRFSNTEVKRPWIDLLSDLPNHLVRTRLLDTTGRERLCCFWISAYRFDRELPTWSWYLLL